MNSKQEEYDIDLDIDNVCVSQIETEQVITATVIDNVCVSQIETENEKIHRLIEKALEKKIINYIKTKLDERYTSSDFKIKIRDMIYNANKLHNYID